LNVYPSYELYAALAIRFPGAQISKQRPTFENEAQRSSLVVAPVVKALAALAGDFEQASAPLSFPAATATTIPCLTAEFVASFSEEVAGPPRDMLMTPRTPFLRAWSVAHLMPAMIPEYDPEPFDRTFTG